MRKMLVGLSLLAVALSAPYAMSAEVSQPIPSAPICYVKIDTIKGESVQREFLEWIEGYRFTTGVSNVAPQGRSGGGGMAGRPTQEPITITKMVGGASAPLYRAAVLGMLIKIAEVHFVMRSERGIEPVYIVKLHDVLISNIKQYTDGTRLFEDISLVPARVEISSYTRKQDGSVGSPNRAEYDFKTNKGR